jgi:hypothetical protein
MSPADKARLFSSCLSADHIADLDLRYAKLVSPLWSTSCCVSDFLLVEKKQVALFSLGEKEGAKHLCQS